MLVCCSFTCWSPGGSQNGPMKYGLFILPLCCLCRCFHGIGSLDFSEFWHGARNPYHVVGDRAGVFLKNFFCPQNWGNGSKIGFFEFKKNLFYDFHWICSIMKTCIVCCVPAQILYLGKFLFLKYRSKWSQPTRFQDFQINHFSKKQPKILCMLI